MRPPSLALAATDLRVLSRRRWLGIAAALGLAAVIAIAFVASRASGDVRDDRLHTGGFNLMLLGGVAVAIGLGATALNRDAERGFLGLIHTAGARRAAIGLGRALGRLGALTCVMALWAVGLQVASLVLGRGLDGPLALLGLACLQTAALILLICAAASAFVGATTAGVVGAIGFAMTQAFTNLGAAADQGLIGSVWRDASDALATALPRQIHTPLSADLVNRGEGGPGGQRFEVNGVFAQVDASSWLTVAWTALWCLVFLSAAVNGMRNREL